MAADELDGGGQVTFVEGNIHWWRITLVEGSIHWWRITVVLGGGELWWSVTLMECNIDGGFHWQHWWKSKGDIDGS